MLKENVQQALNEQIKNELYSGYLYLAMSAYSERRNLPGFAHWFRKQAEEEVGHAMRLFDYVHDRGGEVVLQAIDQPQSEWDSPLTAFEDTLAHERLVTGLIHKLYETALAAKDYGTQSALKWFIDEQVEEEKTAELIVAQLEMVGDKGHALLMLDRALGERE